MQQFVFEMFALCNSTGDNEYISTPGRQQIINTITKLGPAIEASLGWGTVQNNIKFHLILMYI